MAGTWTVELSDEVSAWFHGLAASDQAPALRAFELLQERGPMLRMPHSKPLGDSLFELRFHCERVTYVFDADRRVITLTTFRKQRQNESREIKRARRAKAAYDKSKEEQ